MSSASPASRPLDDHLAITSDTTPSHGDTSPMPTINMFSMPRVVTSLAYGITGQYDQTRPAASGDELTLVPDFEPSPSIAASFQSIPSRCYSTLRFFSLSSERRLC